MIYRRGKNGIYSYRFRFAGRMIHESARMLERYSHIRTEAKRAALDAIMQQPNHAVFGEVVHQNVHQLETGPLDAPRKSLN